MPAVEVRQVDVICPLGQMGRVFLEAELLGCGNGHTHFEGNLFKMFKSLKIFIPGLLGSSFG